MKAHTLSSAEAIINSSTRTLALQQRIYKSEMQHLPTISFVVPVLMTIRHAQPCRLSGGLLWGIIPKHLT